MHVPSCTSPYKLTSLPIEYLSNTKNARLPIALQDVALAFEFTDDTRYDLDSAETWRSLVPPKTAGFVHLGEDATPYSVSMYHSLHCLATIRRALSEADNHSDHCFDYLTQLLSCKADSTLEQIVQPQGMDNDGNKSAVPAWAGSGSGVVHRCRDWTQIRSFVEKNRDEKKIFPPTD
ncbi:hypothetical protein CONPUDRAFT_54070 [Coniophora puteana RWD-64-598 SS2]|uniref:Uncharacterized protein n=1 Tax=Coniophora puteana (strain RWD-64-598) TaxID=741705 RepID=A0A5M3MRL5_CONPW|nr:uncharacterized protein CONPUDRAFT_54070 [Coniophora puteana RWD-64-598 SS2]EIW81726.1 hypothetical protein CONPUDRAFT_54070 [Coniophora puteana RWD-64-598 SS2]